MKPSGSCPCCGEKIRFHMKDKVTCSGCGVTVQSDPKQANIFSFIILIAIFVTYPVDWRLSVTVAIVISIIGFKTVKYKVVDR